MDREQALNIVRSYKREIMPIVGQAKVMLFGSYAKGTAKPDSDIDVAVIVPTLQGDWLDTSSALWLATMRVDTTIEPVLIDARQESPLYEDIRRTGILI